MRHRTNCADLRIIVILRVLMVGVKYSVGHGFPSNLYSFRFMNSLTSCIFQKHKVVLSGDINLFSLWGYWFWNSLLRDSTCTGLYLHTGKTLLFMVNAIIMISGTIISI